MYSDSATHFFVGDLLDACKQPLVPSCAAPRLPVAEPVYSAEAVYDQVRESTVLAVDNAKHAVGMA